MNNVAEFESIINQMKDLYIKKNSNYGNSFSRLIEQLGPIAGLVPLHNKLDRLDNLITGGKNDFESIEDTLIDLANYAILNIIELRANNLKTEKLINE